MGAERMESVSTSFFGNGAVEGLTEELKKKNVKRALIVTDRFLFENKTADKTKFQVFCSWVKNTPATPFTVRQVIITANTGFANTSVRENLTLVIPRISTKQ